MSNPTQHTQQNTVHTSEKLHTVVGLAHAPSICDDDDTWIHSSSPEAHPLGSFSLYSFLFVLLGVFLSEQTLSLQVHFVTLVHVILQHIVHI